jgi:carbamoyltransferase
VDGSARVQTVTASSAPLLDAVLAEMGRRTDVPVVLNTSLNGAGEPILGASATDALAFFVAHPVDAMLIGDVLVERHEKGAS